MKHYRIYLAAALFLAANACLAADKQNHWQLSYEDNFNYSGQNKDNTTFNTWFWREDSVGLHRFEYVNDANGCTAQKPCVKLTAPFQPEATAYINAEMYNNSCVKRGVGHPQSQPFDQLAGNPLSAPLQLFIQRHCDKPYPYRKDPATEGQLQYANNSWNTTTPGSLTANPWSFTKLDAEAPWLAVRDIAFNNPYLANAKKAIRMTVKIRVEGQGGGSRGWGFWNTTLSPENLQLAWFMEYSTQQAKDPAQVAKSVVMQTMSFDIPGKIRICSTPLPDKDYSIYQWHEYQIEWSPRAVNYFADGHWLASHTQAVPNAGMAFHNWVDNRNYFSFQGPPDNFPLFQEKSNYISRYRIEEMPVSQYHMPAGQPAYASTTSCASIPVSKDLIDLLKSLAKEYVPGAGK